MRPNERIMNRTLAEKYLNGVSDAGNRLLFKFRSGTHGLKEELSRHRGREGKGQCTYFVWC